MIALVNKNRSAAVLLLVITTAARFQTAHGLTVPYILGNGGDGLRNCAGDTCHRADLLAGVIGVRAARTGCHLTDPSAGGAPYYDLATHTFRPQFLDSQMVKLQAASIDPVCQVIYYRPMAPDPLSLDWFGIGKSLAERFRPASSFWKSRGITDYGVTTYSAFNEPENSFQNPPVNEREFHESMKRFAQGIKSVDPALKVIAGATYAVAQGWQDNMAGCLADLINCGLLDGINHHFYFGNFSWSVDEFNLNNWTPQSYYDGQINTYKIRPNAAFYSTEFSVSNDFPDAARNQFSLIWNALGVADRKCRPVTGKALTWNLLYNTAEDGVWGQCTRVQPWDGTAKGDMMQMIAKLTDGMHFVRLDPRRESKTKGSGQLILDGAGKRLWVWHNRVNWTDRTGTSFVLTNIPPAATTLEVYRHNSWEQSAGSAGSPKPFQTVPLANQTSYTVTGLIVGETYLFLANASGGRLDNFPPRVTITSPVGGASVRPEGGALTIMADASDIDGTVAKVAFYEGSSFLGEDISYPYGVTINALKGGPHLVRAIATDNQGVSDTSAPVSFTLANHSVKLEIIKDWGYVSRFQVFTGSGWDTVKYSDPSILYAGFRMNEQGWAESNLAGSTAEFGFHGSRVRLVAGLRPWGGTARAYVDGSYWKELSFFVQTCCRDNVVIFEYDFSPTGFREEAPLRLPGRPEILITGSNKRGLTALVTSPGPDVLTFTLFNVRGRTVAQVQANVHAGRNEVPIAFGSLPGSLYQIVVSSPRGRFIKRFATTAHRGSRI